MKIYVSQCLLCGKEEVNKRCSACKTAHYCSKDCAVKHWTMQHKFWCKFWKNQTRENYVRAKTDHTNYLLENNEDISKADKVAPNQPDELLFSVNGFF